MDAYPAVLAVVIGRAGSKGLPGKNTRMLAGHPLVWHTIDAARRAHAVSRTVVSTDGDEIAEAARNEGIDVIARPPHLATDEAPVCEVVRHAVRVSCAVEPVVVILYANVPVRPSGLIDRAVGLLRDTGADSVQSYSHPGKNHPYWMAVLDEEHRVQPFIKNSVHRRQDLPKLSVLDGGVIAVTHESLFAGRPDDPHAFLGTDRRGIESPPGSVVDVDTLRDLHLAEAALRVPATEAVA